MQNVTVSRKLGARIRKIRIEKGLTQEELALEAKLNRAFIGYIERVERNAWAWAMKTLRTLMKQLPEKFSKELIVDYTAHHRYLKHYSDTIRALLFSKDDKI